MKKLHKQNAQLYKLYTVKEGQFISRKMSTIVFFTYHRDLIVSLSFS